MTNAQATEIEIVRKLIRTATSYVEDSDFYPRESLYLDRVLFGLLSKNIRVAEAICLLVENGFGDEAFGLSRTMLEICFSARYIVNSDSLERSERFVKFYAKDHASWTDILPKFYPNMRVDQNPRHDELLEMAKDLKGPAHRWSGRPVSDLALEPDTQDVDDQGQPAKCELDYEVIYKWTSHFVHGTIVALDTHAVEAGKKFYVMGGVQIVEKRWLALFNAAVYLARTFGSTFRGIGHDIRTDVANEFLDAVKELVRRHKENPSQLASQTEAL